MAGVVAVEPVVESGVASGEDVGAVPDGGTVAPTSGSFVPMAGTTPAGAAVSAAVCAFT